MIRHVLKAIILIILSLLSNSVFSQKNIYTTAKITGEPPVINGTCDDKAWNIVAWGGNFTQIQPYENRPPSQPTFFKIIYDDNNLYAVIFSYDSVPGEIVKRMSRRDGMEGDLAEIQIDSYNDQRTAFSFTISAGGVKNDRIITEDGNYEDDTWDPIWYVKTSVTDSGWIAEMSIPLTQLRFNKNENQVWGLQVGRKIFRNDEYSAWQFIPQDASGWVHMFGELHGLTGLKPKRQIDMTPYLVAKEEFYERDEEDPFSKGSEMKFSAGLDGKVGVTNDLTLDYTINPDFGQVEADPSEVNLTAFETFFQEKRPFFIEGKNIFDFPFIIGDSQLSRDRLFYSRRIGRAPQYYPDLDDDKYIDTPDNTTILGAFKLTGKTKDGLSVGVMESVTAQEIAEIDTEGSRKKVEVEPLTNYFTGRVQQDFNKGNTILGGMITATNRKITNHDIDFLPDAAYTGGIDFQQFWKDKSYYVRLKGVVSTVVGDTAAITNIQRSSVHYFQRPDATYLKVDSSRTSLAGEGGTIEFGKTGGGHLSAIAWVTWRSPGLELNDMGYLRSGDEVFQVVWMGYRIWEPFSIFRSININMNQWTGWDFGGRSTYYGGNINFNTQFKNYWSFGMGVNQDGPSLLKAELRGGPSLAYPPASSTWFSIYSDDRKKFSYGAWLNYAVAPLNHDIYSQGGLDFIIHPVNALRISLSPFAIFNQTHLQYVDICEFNNEDRYVMAYIDQTTFGLTARVDINITPDITLQYYGQPFVSAGDYTEFKRITDAHADKWTDHYLAYSDDEISYDAENEIYSVDEDHDGTADYSFDNPNFNFKQFRSNLVFRWEYIPGSTLFLVWSQDRTGADVNGHFNFNNDFSDLFHIYPGNVFLIKVSYRIAI
ncbi:MAG: DUF5916 domain-containing protein [Bacteroidetes bacterium]|nr:DUF5916 domain-containing protein [Bacteroidota bacterium]